MDRNNSRYNNYNHNRRQQGQSHQSSLSSSSSNNNQHHRNSGSSSTNTNVNSQSVMVREPLTQHDELIRYIKEAWTKVNEQGTPVYYRNEPDQLKNFKPFNLEEYWGQRLVQNIHVSHGHQ